MDISGKYYDSTRYYHKIITLYEEKRRSIDRNFGEYSEKTDGDCIDPFPTEGKGSIVRHLHGFLGCERGNRYMLGGRNLKDTILDSAPM